MLPCGKTGEFFCAKIAPIPTRKDLMIIMKCEYPSLRKRSVLAFVLVIALAFPVFAAESVPYVNRTADASGNVTSSNATCETYTVVTSGSTSWSDGWYVVNSEVTIGSRVSVSGTVYLILCDGATLTVNGGIQLTGSNSLTIYG